MENTTANKLSFDTLPAPPCRPLAGGVVIILGIILMVVGLVGPTLGLYALEGDFNIDNLETEVFWAYVIFVLLILLGFYAGAWLIARGRRMRAVPATVLLADEEKPPVLYLRSFDDDDLVDPTPRMIPLGDYFERRYEESVCGALEAIGPMVSIGRPGNTLAQLGGARLFVPDHAWQTAVEYLRRKAAAVVLVVGRTEGLWWEIQTSLQEVSLERLLFFFPYVEETRRRRSILQRYLHVNPSRMPLSGRAFKRMEAERHSRYELFRQHVQPLIQATLPESMGTSQFLDFTDDGKPRLLETIRPWWKPLAFLTPSATRMIINLERTLQPFVDKLLCPGLAKREI